MSWKKRLRNLVIWILALIVFPLFLLWLYVAQPTVKHSEPTDLQASPERLEKHVRILSETFAPRSFAHFKNLNGAADYIRDEFTNLNSGGIIEDQVYDTDGQRYRNISLFLNSGSSNDPRIVVGAHYDGYGEFPAADDNASGVAGLIETARLIAAEKSFTSPIEFVAYPLEEPPHFRTDAMGSAHHAKGLKQEKREVKLMISLEMIGYFSDKFGSQDYPSPILRPLYPARGNFIAVVGRSDMRDHVKEFKIGMKGTTDLPVYSIAAPAAIPGIDFSDHRNYWRYGYPAIMVTDTAFYRNKNYHSAKDTADLLDFDKMADVVTAVTAALLAEEGSELKD